MLRRPLIVAMLLAVLQAAPAAGQGDAARGDVAQGDAAQGDVARGYEALRAGRPVEAAADFVTRLAAAPDDTDALVGAGFAALRLRRLDEAVLRFERALALAPAYADAAYGLATCRMQQDRPADAKPLLRRVLALDPERADRADVETALARAEDLAPDPLPPFVRPAQAQLAARVRGRAFEVQDANGAWRPLFVKGINLGAALPGRHSSEFPDRATYREWIRAWGELGVNVVRVYTIHPPWFYEELAAYDAVAAHPIRLVHGVWAEPPPDDDFGGRAWRDEFDAETRHVIDLLHGNALISPRPGHAAGRYTADVSRWTLALILGREWEPFNVVAYNERRRGLADWSGRFVRVTRAHATEIAMAQLLDGAIAYEQDTYDAQRPIAFTNWPTLDPLTHPTEPTKAEEQLLRARLGLPLDPGEVVKEYDNDAVGLDMEKYEAQTAFHAGLFASYHAYPYYPDFINLDPGYGRGGENYAAYLADLVAHHRRHPVLVAEFGVPASRLVAHWQVQGFTHGGQNETQQGVQDAALFRTIHDTGCAGGILFAWIDEWFKKNWLVIDFEEPLERKPLWYNAQDAEENYGLVAYRPGADGPAIVIDGRPDDWERVPPYAAAGDLRLQVTSDEGWLYLALTGPAARLAGDVLLGIDTHDLRRGDHRLPFGASSGMPSGTPFASAAGLEFVVHVAGGGATLLVDAPYDPFTHRYARPYVSVDNADGRFVMPRTESNRQRIARDGTVYPARRQEIGTLVRGTTDRTAPDYDSRAEWARGEGFLELRLPWGLLLFTDPSSRRVVCDRRGAGPGDEVGTAVTDGVRVLAVAGDATLPAADGRTIPAPPLYTWPTWEQPTFHSYRKASFDIVRRALADLPDAPCTAAGVP